MYEKEIEMLLALGTPGPAIRTAIALMTAAEPKDAAAEREHCNEVAERYHGGNQAPCLRAEILRERAAARAEGRTMRERLQTENVELRGIVGQLRAEIAELRHRLEGLEK